VHLFGIWQAASTLTGGRNMSQELHLNRCDSRCRMSEGRGHPISDQTSGAAPA